MRDLQLLPENRGAERTRTAERGATPKTDRKKASRSHPSGDVRRLWEAGRVSEAAWRLNLELLAATLGITLIELRRLYGDPEREPEPGSVVYLIGPRRDLVDGIPVKIGHTRRPIYERLNQLQPGSIEFLRLIAYLPGDRDLERELHSRLAEHQIREDWFRMCGGIRTVFSTEPADSGCTCRRHAWDPACPRHGREMA